MLISPIGLYTCVMVLFMCNEVKIKNERTEVKKILITYATRPLGLRVAKLLSPVFGVEKATSDDVPSVLSSSYSKIPKGANPIYAHEMLKLALDKGCQYILPLGIDEAKALAEASVLFDEYGIRVLCPGREDLADVNYLQDPSKDLQLCLINDKKDMLSGQLFDEAPWDGLCIVSDSGDDFIWIVQ